MVIASSALKGGGLSSSDFLEKLCFCMVMMFRRILVERVGKKCGGCTRKVERLSNFMK